LQSKVRAHPAPARLRPGFADQALDAAVHPFPPLQLRNTARPLNVSKQDVIRTDAM
jgi:hypothetical protein